MVQEWFRCQEQLNGTPGTICGKPFTRQDNLKRHIRTQHQARQAQEPRQAQPAGLEALALQGLLQLSQTQPTELTHISCQPSHSQGRSPTSHPCSTQISADVQDMRTISEQAVTIQRYNARATPYLSNPLDEAASASLNTNSDEGDRDSRTKKRWFNGRCIYQSVMPQYDTKRSRKWPSQQKALSWLSTEAKDVLDQRIGGIMKQWGQSRNHKGTCLLLPADWESAQPAEIATKLSPETCPSISDAHVTHKYSDHTTLLSRAIAWFETETWPRTGIQLDCFIECGPFERQDGSHLCIPTWHRPYPMVTNHGVAGHNSLCINPHHLAYESVQANLDRIKCHDEAKALRRGNQGRKIPANCKAHDPPCLMQHSVLSTYERLALQFWVLEKASPSSSPLRNTRRPRWHTFPTFETELPLKFLHGNEHCAVKLNPQDLKSAEDAGLPATRTNKPTFMCVFCPGVKSFSSTISYWGHLLRKHAGREQQIVDEVRRTAKTWEAYWSQFPAQKSTEPTRKKLQQTTEPGFGWDTILSWNLR